MLILTALYLFGTHDSGVQNKVGQKDNDKDFTTTLPPQNFPIMQRSSKIKG